MKDDHIAVHKETASQGQCRHSPPQLSTFLGKTRTQASFGVSVSYKKVAVGG